MSSLLKNMTRAGVVLVGLAVGVGLMALFVITGEGPGKEDAAARVPTVRVVEVESMPFRLEARGHGVSRAAETWQAVAKVPGRVIERDPGLESGKLVKQGTLLLRLDPSRYELAIAEATADRASLKAELAQVDKEESNTHRLLELERTRLELAEKELERIERLAAQGSVSHSQRDAQRRTTVAQRQAVVSLENQLALIPARKQRLAAQADRAATRIEQARQDLEDTRFVAPYDARIEDVQVELHQNANAGQLLFRADSIEAAEIEAHIPFTMLRRLMGSVAREQVPSDALDLGEHLDFSAIHARVVLAGAKDIQWRARVSRVATGLDPRTRTARVVVTVEAPYAGVAPPERPALQPGMYVDVRLSAPSPTPLIALPAAAVHDDEVYRVTQDERLERRPVTVAFEQHDLAVIREGLAAGDRVIVDDPLPALNGMAVKPERDQALERVIRARAQGRMP